MTTNHLLLLGPPGLTVGGEPQRLDRKPLALLAWLALAEGPISRTSLAELLWPDSTQPGVNLRKSLTEIRLAAGAVALAEDMTHRTLALGPGLWVDARAFDLAMAEVAAHGHADGPPCLRCMAGLNAALSWWRGEFIAGFRLPGCPEWDDWQALHAQRLALRRQWALDHLALGAAARGDWPGALGLAQQRLALDPIDEAGHRRLARILAWSDQGAAALRQLEACARTLAAELQLGPSAATVALEEAIRAERLPPPPEPPDRLRQEAAAGHPEGLTPRVDDQASAQRVGAPQALPIVDRIHVLEETRTEFAPRTLVGLRPRRELPPVPPAIRTAQGRLLAAVLHPEAQAELPEDALAALAALPPVDLTTYRLSRVAAWSLPRYRLDRGFVSLSLLLDQGRDRQERWLAGPERFQDLRAVLTALRDPALVLLGPPGAGKSTLLRRLELDIAVDGLRGAGDLVPFLVPLNAFRSPGGVSDAQDPGAWLAERWRQRCPLLPTLDSLLLEGRMLILLDGLNEMPYRDDAGQRELTEPWRVWLQDLAERATGNRVLFSCRGLDYSAPLSTPRLPVPQIQLELLSDEQIRALVCGLAGDAAEETLLWLERAPDWNLLRSPYTLRLLVDQMLAGEAGALDWVALQVAVLRRALRRELERGNPSLMAADGESPLFTARDRRRVLQTLHWPDRYALPEDGRLFDRLSRLAWKMQAGRVGGEASQVRIRYADAVSALDDPAAEAILRAGHSLGLIEDDAQRDELAFSHQLLQEHFAARRLATTSDLSPLTVAWRAAQLRPSLADTLAGLGRADPLPPAPGSGWEETALQAVALSRQPAAFIAEVKERDLLLAGRCAKRLQDLEAERAQAGEARATRAVPPATTSGASPFVASPNALDQVQLDGLRWSLVERLRDPAADLRVRIAAGLVLGELGDPRLKRREGPLGACLIPPLVTLPAGEHWLGDDRVGGGGMVHLPSFAISALELSNAEWACFMAGGGYEDPRWWDTPAARDWQQGLTTADDTAAQARTATARFRADPHELDRLFREGHMAEDWYALFRRRIAMEPPDLEAHLAQMYPGGRLTAPRFWLDPAFNNPAQPVVGISWFEARAYTLWLAAQTGEPYRLPTELEWEAAARSAGGLTIADDEALEACCANTSELHVWRPSPMGVFPAGETAEGVADLCGNVWEWTSSVFGADADHPLYTVPRLPGTEAAAEDPGASPQLRRVARGGAWDSPRSVAMAWVRDAVLPGGRDAGYGMRLGWG